METHPAVLRDAGVSLAAFPRRNVGTIEWGLFIASYLSQNNLMNIKSESQQKLTYLPYLDGWRGIAIIMVLLGHFNSFGKTHHLGSFGVTIFFVLSGFLMSRILFIQKTPLNIFYRRRLARILPVFWLYISIIFIGGWVFFREFDLYEFLCTAFFLRTYFPDASIFKSYVPIGHIWSLNVEEHCYIFLSLFSILAIRFGEIYARLTLTLSSLLCIALFIFYNYFHHPVAQTLFEARSEVAAFPLLLSSTLFLWLTKYPIKVPSNVPLIFFFCALIIAILSKSSFLSYIVVSILLAISINTLTIAPFWIKSILSNTVLRWFGICSYSIYLWQQVFFSLRNMQNIQIITESLPLQCH